MYPGSGVAACVSGHGHSWSSGKAARILVKSLGSSRARKFSGITVISGFPFRSGANGRSARWGVFACAKGASGKPLTAKEESTSSRSSMCSERNRSVTASQFANSDVLRSYSVAPCRPKEKPCSPGIPVHPYTRKTASFDQATRVHLGYKIRDAVQPVSLFLSLPLSLPHG